MPVWAWILGAVLILAVVGASLILYRLHVVRAAGTPMLIRALPAERGARWRHGAAHYTDDALLFYRLSSLRPGPSLSLSRRRIEVIGRRAAVGTEAEIMDDDDVVVEIAVGRNGRGGRYELSMTPDLVMAFQSWIEARAPKRARRNRPAA